MNIRIGIFQAVHAFENPILIIECEITLNWPPWTTMNVKKDIANRCESLNQKCQKQDQFSQDNRSSGSDLDSFV